MDLRILGERGEEEVEEEEGEGDAAIIRRGGEIGLGRAILVEGRLGSPPLMGFVVTRRRCFCSGLDEPGTTT